MMRRVVVVLLAINVLYALWHVLRPAAPQGGDRIQQSDVAVSLVLISEITATGPGWVADAAMLEQSGVEDAHHEAGRGEGAASLGEYSPSAARCARIGRFSSDAEMDQFLAEAVGGRPYRLVVGEEPLLPLHRVFLPAATDRSEALVVLADVRSTIERAGTNIDTYLIVGGEFDNVVSLGLFSEPNNALNVKRVLEGHGYQPQIQIENRARQTREILVELEKDSDFEEKTLQSIQTMGLSLELVENLCEMIAQQG